MKHRHTKQNHKGTVSRKKALIAYSSKAVRGPRATKGAAGARGVDEVLLGSTGEGGRQLKWWWLVVMVSVRACNTRDMG